MMTLRRPLAVAVSLATLAACSDSTEPTPRPIVARIDVAGLPDTAGVGDTLHATAQPLDSTGAAIAGVAVRWRALTPAVATVDTTGVVVVRDVGEARFVVSARGRTTVEDTVVLSALLLPSRLVLSGLGTSMALGSRDTASAEVRDGRGGVVAETVRWSTNDDWVLSVDSASGAVVARGAGTAWVRARAGRASDSVRVEVPLVPLMPGHVWTQVAGHSLNALPGATCALDATGQVWCEGAAGPVVVPGATRLRELQGGQSQYCGLDAGGLVHCVGRPGTFTFGVSLPQGTLQIDSLYAGADGRRFLRYALGDHHTACGIQAADSVVYCWGHDDQGQTGRLPMVSADSAVAPITGNLKATQLDLTGFSGCAIALDQSVWCWGSPSYYGRTDGGYLPAQVQPPGRFTSVATGDLAVCGLSADGAVSCWGAYVGTPGTGTPTATPRPLTGMLRFTRIVARDFVNEFCGLTGAGALYCWGTREGAGLPAMTPMAVLPGRTFTSVTLARYRRCAVVTGGDAFCF